MIPGSSSHPADVYLPNWRRGHPAALDIHVISTMQQQTLVGASTNPGYALQVGEERKMAAHAGACRAAGVPLVVESLGGWSYEAIQTIKSIGRLQGQHLGLPPPDPTDIFSSVNVEREWVAVGQAAASPFSNDRWTCLTFVFFVLFVFACFCFVCFLCCVSFWWVVCFLLLVFVFLLLSFTSY